LAGRIRAGLSPKEGRKFGLLVGGAFLVFGALFLWRGRVLPMQIMSAIGAPLLLAGLIIPGRLGPVYNAWMGLALAISKVTTPIFMGIVYFIILAPLGLARRLFGWNSLRHKAPEGSFWQDRKGHRTGGLTRQF